MAEEDVEPERIDPTLTLIAGVTDVMQRLAMLQEVTLELVKIQGERIDAMEHFQQGLSFEDMVDGKVPPIGITADQRERLLKIQEQLSERLPDLPHGI
jgi:hypothetical protein